MIERHSNDTGAAEGCPNREDLAAAIHGTISDHQLEQQITEHLSTCARCRDLADECAGWNDVEDRIRSMQNTPGELPESVRGRLREAGPELTPTPSPARHSHPVIQPPATTRVSEISDDPPPQKKATRDHSSDVPDLLQRLLMHQESASETSSLKYYRIDNVIARGGMGIVVRARDLRLERDVAMKFLDPKLTGTAEFHQRFTREAQAIASVPHPNIVRIFEVGQWQDIPYLVMEYVEGETLSQRIRRSGTLPLDEIVRIGSAITLGLAAVHEQGIIHRDLKPSNVLIGFNGQGSSVRLSDFGLARAAGNTDLTAPGIVPGTPAYMSPEQATGRSLDDRTDLYSLGCVLHSMCCGRPPAFRRFRFSETDESDAPRTETAITAQVEAHYPVALIRLIDRLLATDPDARIQSASQVARILFELGRETDTLADSDFDTFHPRDLAAPAAPTVVMTAGQLPVPEQQSRLAVQEVIAGIALTASLVFAGWHWFDSDDVDSRDTSAPVTAGDFAPTNRDRAFDKGQANPPVLVEPAKPPLAGDSVVLLSPTGETRLKTASIAGALRASRSNDVVEIRHTGELTIPPLIIERSLTIRAAPGFQPVLVPRPDADGGYLPLFNLRAGISLEDLRLATPVTSKSPRTPRPQMLLRLESGTLKLSNCEIDLRMAGFGDVGLQVKSADRVNFLDCRVTGGVAVDLDCQISCRMSFRNTLLHGACPLIVRPVNGAGQSTVEFSNCTVIAESVCSIAGRDPLEIQEKSPLRWSATDSILAARLSLFTVSRLTPGAPGVTFNQTLGDSLWCVADCSFERCVFNIDSRYISGDRPTRILRPGSRQEIDAQKNQPRIATLADFCRLASATATDSVEINLPFDAPLLRATTAEDLRSLQADILAKSAKVTQRDLSTCGAHLPDRLPASGSR